MQSFEGVSLVLKKALKLVKPSKAFEKELLEIDINEEIIFLKRAKELILRKITKGNKLNDILEGYHFYIHVKDISAEMVKIPLGYKVLVGSMLKEPSENFEVNPSFKNLRALRRKLLNENKIIKRANKMVLQEDLIFDSPSGAAQFILGRSANGRIEWKTEEGKTIKEIEEGYYG